MKSERNENVWRNIAITWRLSHVKGNSTTAAGGQIKAESYFKETKNY